jgi:glycolate oxidase
MTMRFRKVDRRAQEKLASICGADNVLCDPEVLERYSRDESGTFYARFPEAVVKPESVREIREIISFASEYRIPITPRGAGSGVVGGAVPLRGGVVLALEKMNRVLEIDRRNLCAVVEPGAITNDLCRAVQEEGLFYPGYPMSVETSSVGGNVATNAGGSKVIKYGNTGRHVLGLEAVIPSGGVLFLGGKRRKDSSGYNLLQLLVGSEGTLAVFSKIIVNLIPLPRYTVDLLIPFSTIEGAIGAVPQIVTESKILPCAVEFLDRGSILLGSRYTKTRLDYQEQAEAYLIIQFDGVHRGELEEAYMRAGETCLKKGALEVFVAENPFASEKLWRLRRNYLEAMKMEDPYVVTADVVVPTASIPRMMERIQMLSKKWGVEIFCVAHAGDGNIHAAPLKPHDVTPEEWQKRQGKILHEIAREAIRLGGAPSGEHGIGYVKKQALYRAKRKEIPLMRALKHAFDPAGILNPGKLF